MNPHSGTNDDDYNNIRKTKAIAAIPMAGIIVTIVLVSGLMSFMGNNYQPVIAQTDNATTTTTDGGVGQFPCAPIQAEGAGGGGGGDQNTTRATTTMGDVATTDANTSSSTTDEGNQATGELAIHIQEACLAAHNNDIPGVLLHMNLALDALNALRMGGSATTNATTAAVE